MFYYDTECKHRSSDTSNTSDTSDTSRRYPNLEFARVYNSNPAGQTITANNQPLIFNNIFECRGDIVKFTPNTGNIILEDNAAYLIIYESTITATGGTTVTLQLQLDGTPIPGSESVATVPAAAATGTVTLVSHAIITTPKCKSNVLTLVVSATPAPTAAAPIIATGANISIIKLAELKKGQCCNCLPF